MDWTEAHLQGDLEAMQQAREEAIVRAALERAAKTSLKAATFELDGYSITHLIRSLADDRDEINAILLKASREDRG
jgi:uncharacterized protein (DUF1778 family)